MELNIINENILIPKDKLEINIEDWDIGNPLFIIGASGDGKSTLADKMAKENNALKASTDVPLLRVFRTKEKFDRIMNSNNKTRFQLSKVEKAWLDAHQDLEYEQDFNDNLDIVKVINVEYVEWITEYSKNNNILLVIEGCDLTFLGPEYFIDKPLIIMGNSRVISLWRRSKRDHTNHSDISLLKAIFDQLRKYYPNFYNLDKRKEVFRKDIEGLLNEEYVDDPKGHELFNLEKAIKDEGFYSYKDIHGNDVPEGIWDSLIKIGNKYYRKRVETLVLKDDKILLAYFPKGDIRIPGGSTEYNKEDIDQASKECNEEVKIKIKNIKYSNINYIEEFKRDWWSILPIEYDGSYTNIYVAEYAGPYLGKIKKQDQDSDMLKYSKWYDLDKVYNDLKPEWQLALSKYLNESNIETLDMKSIMEDVSSLLETEYDPPYTYKDIVKVYGKDIADKLKEDPAHRYRMGTGIELIHREPSKKELERIWNNWNLMDPDQKRQSDIESRRLYGIDNRTHYNQLIKETYIDNVNDIKTIEQLHIWMSNNIEYEQHDGTGVYSYEEVLKKKKGHCYDQVEFEKVIFKKLGIKYGGLFMIEYKEGEWPKGYNTHSLLYYYEDNKIYWFENAWYDQRGIHGYYKNIDDLKDDLASKWDYKNGCNRLYITSLKSVQHGMSVNDYAIKCIGDKALNKEPTNSYIKENAIIPKYIFPITEDIIEEIPEDEREIYYYPLPELVPYFIPEDLERLGVFSELPNNNFYGEKSTLEFKEWFDAYKATGHPGDDYGIQLTKLYEEYMSDPSNKNKQRLLEFGWNPEVPIDKVNPYYIKEIKEYLRDNYGVITIII